MNQDLTNLTDKELTELLEFAETMAEHQQNQSASFAGDPNDLDGCTKQARAHIYRRKNNVRHIDDAEDAAIRRQVRKHLKRRGIVKD